MLNGVRVIPVRDATPAVISIVWLEENHNPLLDVLAATAERLLTVATRSASSAQVMI